MRREFPTKITAPYVRSILIYDGATGKFTNRVNRGPNAPIGNEAGGVHTGGHLKIRIGPKKYYAHRLAWLYVHGEWPPTPIDHIDGDPSNNRIANLRLATQAQNCRNRRKRIDNTSGHKGVTWDRQRNKWRVQVRTAGRRSYQALFHDIEQAKAAYRDAIKQHHGEFARSE